MQWSAAPNAGFSTADPASLYSPVIDDEIYGYQRINVQAQRADPASLLHKIREMIRIRRAHPAFGRGDLRFLEQPNPAVLAYLRTYGDETILAVHNLSDAPQAVQLDLKDRARVRPIDLFTGQRLSALGSNLLHLEMKRYQYHWWQL
jgi:maltose alpha-D-glucosyltransferase/alpha-amylase